MLIQPSPSGSHNKRQPLLRHNHSDASSYSYSSSCTSFGEVAGGATAECAAICCCCPCGLANFLFLTIYKVPAGLCRRALRRKRRKQLIKKGLLQPTPRCRCGCDDTGIQIHPIGHFDRSDGEEEDTDEEEEEDHPDKVKAREEMLRLEQEMWETFYGTGFWRSPSQREPITLPSSTPTKPIDTPIIPTANLVIQPLF
ncbi:hypothetical protein Tsubulata_009895 [Turnera subulata]|uniref:Uncharacterized protein n=1 Tax=Turnera subulata TaxID=218843 RepID=A0A9Q0FYW1_9ROSI|nr:hypothetical protein Tsubulata_009895 [Turnera subulata]